MGDLLASASMGISWTFFLSFFSFHLGARGLYRRLLFLYTFVFFFFCFHPKRELEIVVIREGVGGDQETQKRWRRCVF